MAGRDEPADPMVAAVFRGYPDDVRGSLHALRRLILDVAARTPGVGPLAETLKWGQPSYLTLESGSGSTVRIDGVKKRGRTCAIYFHCQTDLVETFRTLYPERLRFEGNRAILLDAAEPLPATELAHCVALALTYHARIRRGGAKATSRESRSLRSIRRHEWQPRGGTGYCGKIIPHSLNADVCWAFGRGAKPECLTGGDGVRNRSANGRLFGPPGRFSGMDR